MKNRLLIAALLLVSSASAFAGYKVTANVTVQSNNIAMGSMGSARNSADSLQYIGCEIYASRSYSNLYCRARNSANVELNCWQDAAAFDDMRQVVSSITDGSWIRFDATDAAEPTKCTFVHVINNSKYAPPQP